jgi:hypothetical protein
MKNEFRLVIPPGYTKEEYLRGGMPEEEPTNFWDRKVKVDPVTGTIIEMFSMFFFVIIKCFLFFLEEYPKALAKIREEERAKQKK